jgi:NitT/TauT family transport system substrate-binding protein
VNTWFDTLDYMKAHRGETLQIMAAHADVSVADYLAYEAGTTIFSLEDNIAAFTPGNTDTRLDFISTKIAHFLVATGLAAREPPLDGLLDPSFVQKVE